MPTPLSLPSLDQYLPPGYLTGGYVPYRPPAAPEPEESQFDKLTPAQQAMVRKQIELQDKPRSALGEIGTGLVRGFASGIPETTGKALQWLNLPGQGLRDFADMQNAKYAADLNPEAHGETVQGIASGLESVGPGITSLAALPFLAAGGVPAAAAVTAASAAGAGVFGMAQGQDTYEKAIKAGKTPEEARALGIETGLYEAGGEFLGGKVLGGALTGARRALLRGGKMNMEQALATVRKPNFLPEFAKTMTETSLVETGTEMGQSYAEAAAEKRAGVDDTDPWKAASSSVIPALSMVAFLGPLAGFALHRQQNQNRKAIEAIEAPETGVRETNAAAKQLAPTMEPLVGKEEYALWRLDRMRGAQWFGEQSKQRAQDVAHQEQVVQGEETVAANAAAQQQAADAALVANPPEGAMSFENFQKEWNKQGTFEGVPTGAAVDKNAYLNYLRSQAQGHAEATAAGHTFDPQMSLFVEQGNRIPEAREQPFELTPGIPGDPRFERSAAIAEMEREQESLPFPQHIAGQGELDLAPVMNRPAGERPSPLDDRRAPPPPPTAPLPSGPPKTAMELALEAATAKRGMETQAQRKAAMEQAATLAGGGEAAARAQRATELSISTQQAEKQKERELAKMAKQPAPNMAALELPIVGNPAAKAEAERQLAVTGNTPITQTGLMNVANVATANAGMSMKGQVRKKVEQALATAEGHKLWAGQIAALRKARDALKEGTASRDAMNAVVDHLEKGTPTIPVEPVVKEKQNAPAAKIPQENLGSLFQDPINPSGQGQGTAQAQPSGQQVEAPVAEEPHVVAARALIDAIDAGGMPLYPSKVNAIAREFGMEVSKKAPVEETITRIRAAIDRVDGKTTEEIGGTVTSTTPTVVVKEMTPAANSATIGTAGAGAATSQPKGPVVRGLHVEEKPAPTGEAATTVKVDSVGRTIGWGEFTPNIATDGTISYDTPPPKVKGQQYQRVKYTKEWKKLVFGREVPEFLQEKAGRENTKPESRYVFEQYNYDPSVAVYDNPLNLLWTLDFANAMKRAENVGDKTYGNALVTQDKSKENAAAALEWLKQHDPESYAQGMERVRRVQAILGRDAHVQEVVAKARKAQLAEHRYTYEKELRAKGLWRDTSKMTDAQKAAYERKINTEVQRRMSMDPEVDVLHAELPNYIVSETLAQELNNGTLDSVLYALEANGPSDWIRHMATVLRRLGLKSKINVVNSMAYNEHGERVYGQYHHGDGSISIYEGGENPHTVVHELTHAGTVGRILFAKEAEKKAESARSSEEQAAVAALKELQDMKSKIQKLNPPSQYAFKSEEEFVAEVLSNDNFRNWLDTQVVEGQTWGQRFVGWLRRLFGMSIVKAESALEHATRLSIPYLGNSRFSANSALTYDHSVTGAFSQVDLTITGLVKKYDELAKNNKPLSMLGPRMRETKLAVSSTYHMEQMIERQPVLRPLKDGAAAYRNADATRQMLRTSKQQELSGIITPFDMSLGRMSRAQAAKVNQRLEHLAGEQSILKIDLGKNFDDNVRAGVVLDPSLRDHVNALHSEYRRLDPALRKTLDDSVKAFRKNYIQQSTQMLLAVLRGDERVRNAVAPIIAKLDILDPTLHQGTNPNTRYYFDAYSFNLDRRLRDAFDELEAHSGAEVSALSDQIAELKKFYSLSVANPYHHLGRSGDYFTEFTVKPGAANWGAVQQALADSGKVIGTPNEGRVFMRFDTPAQRSEVHRVMSGLDQHIVQGSLRAGTLADNTDLYNLVRGLPQVAQKLIRSVSNSFSAAEAAQVRDFLIKELLNLQSDTSPSAAMARRRGGGVAGYDADFRRNFSKRSIGMATMLSNAYAMPMFDNAFENMKGAADALKTGNPRQQDQVQEVVNEFAKRFANGLKQVDTSVIDTMKSFGYHWFLAASPAFVIGNLSQPYHLGLPYLGARFGFVASAKEMGRSAKKAFGLLSQAISAGAKTGFAAGGVWGGVRGVIDLSLHLDQSGLSPGEQGMIRELLASGQLDTTQSYELGRFAAGETHTRATVMKVLSAFGHYSEMINRLTMALASYNLESRRAGTQHETATKNAIKSVVETQYDYSEANTASAFGKHGFARGVTPLLVSFKKYSFMTLEMLRRLAFDSIKGETPEIRRVAQKQFGAMMATTSLLGGTLGLPLAPVFAAFADAILGDDDDPSDVKVAFQHWLSETFGVEVGTAIAKGIPRAVLGFDTSARLGLGDVLPGTSFFTDRRKIKDRLESGALDALGPAISAGQDILAGAGKISDGMVMDGLVQMSPLALRGPIKAVKMAEDQGYTTSTGNKLPMEVTPWDFFVQAVGFTPSEKAKQSETNFAVQQYQGLMKQRSTVLSNRFYRAQEKGEDTTEILKDVMEFSTKNPQFKIDLGAGLKSRARARAVAEISGTGVATLPRYLPLLEQYQH